MKIPSRLHRFRAVIAVFVALLLFVVWWFALRPPTADEVANMTAVALAKGDVETLIQLTLPEERQKLHLNAHNVRAFLTETLYRDGYPGSLLVKRVQEYPVDQYQYELQPVYGNTNSFRRPLPIMVTLRPDGRWYLPLGYLLLCTCASVKDAQDALETQRNFKILAHRFDIWGVRLNTSGYNMLPGHQP